MIDAAVNFMPFDVRNLARLSECYHHAITYDFFMEHQNLEYNGSTFTYRISY